MSKVYLDEVKKAQTLVAGLRKNYELVKNRGISREEIANLEKCAKEASEMDQEVESIRVNLSMKVMQKNQKIIDTKRSMHNLKKIIKEYFNQSSWPDFGILDKR